MNDNDALLTELRDIELPQVSWMLAPGWWLLLLFIALLAFTVLLFYRRWQARLWQRQARLELTFIRGDIDQQSGVSVLSRISLLSRKVVLAVDQRERVANLQGEQWLDKLDEICGQPEFSQGIGRLLLDQPYQRQPLLAAQDLIALCESVEVLIDSAGGYKAANQAYLRS